VRVVFSAQAKVGLRKTALFIARDNKPRALSFVDDLRAAARKLGGMPRAFPLVAGHEASGIRSRPFADYLIFYRVQEDQILIVDIIHGARDYEALLFPSA
jgi:toxin ParE1/3/4